MPDTKITVFMKTSYFRPITTQRLCSAAFNIYAIVSERRDLIPYFTEAESTLDKSYRFSGLNKIKEN